MVPQKGRSSTVAVNRIDHIDLLDIMADDLWPVTAKGTLEPLLHVTGLE